MLAMLWLPKHSEIHKNDKNMDEILFGKVCYNLRQGVITNYDRYKLRQVNFKLRRICKLRQNMRRGEGRMISLQILFRESSGKMYLFCFPRHSLYNFSARTNYHFSPGSIAQFFLSFSSNSIPTEPC